MLLKSFYALQESDNFEQHDFEFALQEVSIILPSRYLYIL